MSLRYDSNNLIDKPFKNYDVLASVKVYYVTCIEGSSVIKRSKTDKFFIF